MNQKWSPLDGGVVIIVCEVQVHYQVNCLAAVTVNVYVFYVA